MLENLFEWCQQFLIEHLESKEHPFNVIQDALMQSIAAWHMQYLIITQTVPNLVQSELYRTVYGSRSRARESLASTNLVNKSHAVT